MERGYRSNAGAHSPRACQLYALTAGDALHERLGAGEGNGLRLPGLGGGQGQEATHQAVLEGPTTGDGGVCHMGDAGNCQD